jgi:hypothetical protein
MVKRIKNTARQSVTWLPSYSQKFSTATFMTFRPLHGHSRPPIFHGHRFFSTATFLEIGRHHGHLTPLDIESLVDAVDRVRHFVILLLHSWSTPHITAGQL